MTGQSDEQPVKSWRRTAESLTENRGVRDLELTLDQLVRASQDTHVTLVDVARRLTRDTSATARWTGVARRTASR